VALALSPHVAPSGVQKVLSIPLSSQHKHVTAPMNQGTQSSGQVCDSAALPLLHALP